MSATALRERTARRIRIRGVVQGVGFRPFVHRLAVRHRLGGWVRNESGEVQLVVEGAPASIAEFLRALRLEAPPLADIEQVEVETVAPLGFGVFTIEASDRRPGPPLPVPPDAALCPACAQEMADPGNRRFQYPFITCTDCGPRFSVIEQLPYDRERTTMRVFAQCPACAAEYAAPGNRRYHSETNSCAACGPALWFESAASEIAPGDAPLARAAALLAAGGIVAVRGMGGYHLACDATSETAVAELRRRKHREAKPFAVMVPSLAEVRRLATPSAVEAGLLQRRERPVVLLRIRADSGIADAVAPGLDTIGLMLPSTPLHLLLLEAAGRPLVMTSGNRSEEPIVIDNAEARRVLGPIVDGCLMHDREILSRTDDSVVRVVAGEPLFLRRARGFAPRPLALPVASPVGVLAVGPHLKNTFALARGNRAWMSPHIGDLESAEGLEHFRCMLALYRRLFGIEAEAVAHDCHPGYLSTRFALELELPTTIPVQHHHAHIAAVMAEHGETGPVLGAACDGTGYGLDATVWGSEVLVGDLTGFRRLGHLRPAPLPGGDLAARRPWRAALGYAALDESLQQALAPMLAGVPATDRAIAWRQTESAINSPMASSMGRLFDAAAAVLGTRLVSAYEGQAAMELEALAGTRSAAGIPLPIVETDGGIWQLDPVPLLQWLAERRLAGIAVEDLAAGFHESVSEGMAQLLLRAAEATGVSTIALGGGVFQNARLLDSLRIQLERRRFRVLIPRALPPNDGAISYGQAAMAAAILSARR